MAKLKFIDTNLFISSSSAIISTSHNKPPNVSIPYIHVHTKSSSTGEYMHFLDVTYYYEGNKKLKLCINLNEQEAGNIIGNSSETLNLLYKKLSHNEIATILNSYIVEATDYTFEQLVSSMYSSCLALTIFLIYASLANTEGLKRGDLTNNLFDPFNFKALVTSDDIEDLAAGLNRDNFDYLEPSSLLSQNITSENPIIYGLSLVYPWTQLLSSNMDGATSELHKQEGIFTAMSGVCCVFPHILQKVQNASQSTSSELTKYLELYRSDAEKAVNNINFNVDKVNTTLYEYVNKVDDHTKESLQMIGTCKNTIIDRIRQEVGKCNNDIDSQRLDSLNSLINAGEKTIKNISNKESKVLQSLNSQIIRVNEEVDSMLESIRVLQTSVREKTQVVEERIGNIDNKTFEVNNLVEAKKVELDEFCANQTQKIASVLDERKREYCMTVDCKNRETNRNLENYDNIIGDKMKYLNAVGEYINEKDQELRNKFARVVEDTDSKLDKIDSSLKNGCKHCIRKIDRETEDSIDKIKKETHYAKKCLNDQLHAIEDKLKSEMFTYACNVVREKMGDQLREGGRSLEAEISTALYKQLNDDVIQKRVCEALKSFESCRDGIMNDINSQYNELCQSLKISRDSYNMGTNNCKNIDSIRNQLDHVEKRMNALYDESPSRQPALIEDNKQSSSIENKLLDIISSMQKRIGNLEDTIQVMNSRYSY